jgi:hypothetical protein
MNTNSHFHYVSDTNVLVQRFLCHLEDISVGGTAISLGEWGVGAVMGKGKTFLNYKRKRLTKINLISNVGKVTLCRELFKILNILPVPCVYIKEIVCYIKLNIGKLEQN